ncbi:unnamed protein product [Diamesa hyperborea]
MKFGNSVASLGVFGLLVVFSLSKVNGFTLDLINSIAHYSELLSDPHLQYEAFEKSVRNEKSSYQRLLNAQFLTQVGLTYDSIKNIVDSTNVEGLNSECGELRQQQIDATVDNIQTIVKDVINDFNNYQEDIVHLLLDKASEYVSSNAYAPMELLGRFNNVRQIRIIERWIREDVHNLYLELFEITVEEIIIELKDFDNLVNTTKARAFRSLQDAVDLLKLNLNQQLVSC